ncbi:MAG TPA: histidine triad nucleotide-binding protein [Rhodocyclaceae bacterium]
MSDCIFCKIARGEIPCKKIYEDDDFLAFHDIHPQRPVHFLMIPKNHIATLYDAGPEHEAVLGRMLARAGSLAREQGLGDGFRTIINTGKVGGQEVYHLHLHILGGPLPVGPMVSR